MTPSTSKSRSTDSRPATTMAELMQKHGKEMQTLKKGQEITGVITSMKPLVMMRVNDKTDVEVWEKDKKLHRQLLSFIKIGDTVTATVLYPESESGYPVVTLRKYMGSKIWEELERLQKEAIKLLVTVTEVTKGGLVVEAENGVSGFLPNSHLTGKPEEMMGQKIQLVIVELNKSARKIVFSQKGTLGIDDMKKIGAEYKTGTKVTGIVSGITTFGIFVSLPFVKKDNETITIDGLVHISEISWEGVSDIAKLFVIGQKVEAVVIGQDQRSKRIDLSIKKLTEDPFKSVVDAFPTDKKVTGTVVEMTESGLTVDLGTMEGVAVEGLIKKDKIPPTKPYTKGQKVEATVVSVDSRKRKILLTPVLLEKPLMYR